MGIKKDSRVWDFLEIGEKIDQAASRQTSRVGSEDELIS